MYNHLPTICRFTIKNTYFVGKYQTLYNIYGAFLCQDSNILIKAYAKLNQAAKFLKTPRRTIVQAQIKCCLLYELNLLPWGMSKVLFEKIPRVRILTTFIVFSVSFHRKQTPVFKIVIMWRYKNDHLRYLQYSIGVKYDVIN